MAMKGEPVQDIKDYMQSGALSNQRYNLLDVRTGANRSKLYTYWLPEPRCIVHSYTDLNRLVGTSA